MESSLTIVKPPPAPLDLLCKVSQQFAAGLDSRIVLNKVLTLSIEYIGAVSGSIVVLDDRKQFLETVFLMPGLPTDTSLARAHKSYAAGLARWVARTRQPVLVEDTSQDELGRQAAIHTGDEIGSKSALGLPVLAHQQIVGVMTLVHRAPGFFADEHTILVQIIANLAGMAIVNSRWNADWQLRSGQAFLEIDPNRNGLDQGRADLIEMVYHDLRSPLSNIISSLEALNGITFADPAVDSLLKIALRSTEHVQRLTNSLLDINRLEAGRKLGERNRVDPTSLLNYGASAVQSLVVDKQIGILIEISEELDDLWVDEDMIQRVIINLLENAVKFSPSKGKIWIGAKQMNELVLLWVRDLGPGISPIHQEQIFEKFVRLQPQEKPRGLGLGLAYCRLAVQAHGGEIWVESQPGEGACFKLTLPIISKDKSNEPYAAGKRDDIRR